MIETIQIHAGPGYHVLVSEPDVTGDRTDRICDFLVPAGTGRGFLWNRQIIILNEIQDDREAIEAHGAVSTISHGCE